MRFLTVTTATTTMVGLLAHANAAAWAPFLHSSNNKAAAGREASSSAAAFAISRPAFHVFRMMADGSSMPPENKSPPAGTDPTMNAYQDLFNNTNENTPSNGVTDAPVSPVEKETTHTESKEEVATFPSAPIIAKEEEPIKPRFVVPQIKPKPITTPPAKATPTTAGSTPATEDEPPMSTTAKAPPSSVSKPPPTRLNKPGPLMNKPVSSSVEPPSKAETKPKPIMTKPTPAAALVEPTLKTTTPFNTPPMNKPNVTPPPKSTTKETPAAVAKEEPILKATTTPPPATITTPPLNKSNVTPPKLMTPSPKTETSATTKSEPTKTTPTTNTQGTESTTFTPPPPFPTPTLVKDVAKETTKDSATKDKPPLKITPPVKSTFPPKPSPTLEMPPPKTEPAPMESTLPPKPAPKLEVPPPPAAAAAAPKTSVDKPKPIDAVKDKKTPVDKPKPRKVEDNKPKAVADNAGVVNLLEDSRPGGDKPQPTMEEEEEDKPKPAKPVAVTSAAAAASTDSPPPIDSSKGDEVSVATGLEVDKLMEEMDLALNKLDEKEAAKNKQPPFIQRDLPIAIPKVSPEAVKQVAAVAQQGAKAVFQGASVVVQEGYELTVRAKDSIGTAKVDSLDITYQEAFDKIELSLKGLIKIVLIVGELLQGAATAVIDEIKIVSQKPQSLPPRVVFPKQHATGAEAEEVDVTEDGAVKSAVMSKQKGSEAWPMDAFTAEMDNLQSKAGSAFDHLVASASSALEDAKAQVPLKELEEALKDKMEGIPALVQKEDLSDHNIKAQDSEAMQTTLETTRSSDSEKESSSPYYFLDVKDDQ